MRLIVEICDERGLPAIINIHDVALAQSFVRRIIGLKAGEVVFDGPPDQLDEAVLTRIYGEEDWSATIRPADDDGEEATEEAGGQERKRTRTNASPNSATRMRSA